ncbi:uncharacterized protein LOC134039186 isoform X1 [Osmerus eperlanus]|uniref:uncharacterized protein LOC134039186 isoform X1 n=1 Tax=Osmerus eperlanus TaxID=29151 RepID=UPI002E10DA11
MTSSVSTAVAGVWRAHTVLDESDGVESSPEDRFRKLRSSSSLNSLRMSLRKRLPLRSVQANSLPENPTWESVEAAQKTSTVRQLTRSARNSIGGLYQRLQRNRESVREECLVATPGRICEEGESVGAPSHTPRRTPSRQTAFVAIATPKRTPKAAATPKRTPASRRTPGGRGTPEAGVRGVRIGGGRRQLVRMAALRSPFASPNTQNQRRKFDRDLECVSSGLRKLKNLSHAFNNVIGRDDRSCAAERYGGVMMRRLDPSGSISRSALTHRARRLTHTLGSWTHSALDNVKPKSN